MEKDLREQCMWRSPRGIWLPLLVIMISIAGLISLVVQPPFSSNIINCALILANWGMVVGWIELVISKGKNYELPMGFAIIALVVGIIEVGFSVEVLLAIIILVVVFFPVWILLVKVQQKLCMRS